MPPWTDSVEMTMKRTANAEIPGAVIAEEGISRSRDQSKMSPGLERTLLDHDVRGEKSIAKAQAGICAFIFVLYFGSLSTSSLQELNLWVPVIVSGLMATSLFRYLVACKTPFLNWAFEPINVIDISIYLSLIWSYQFTYEMTAGSVLKAPSLTLLFVLIGLRALRIHPIPILVTGSAAVIGWGLMTLFSVLSEGQNSITRSYSDYLTSEKILIGSEVEKMVALGALTICLAFATKKARDILSKAADASDYAKALGSAQENLVIAEAEKEKAVQALHDLDEQDNKLAERNKLFNIALDKMTQGLCMFDANKKLLVCNQLYIEMYDLSPALSKPGTSFRSILEYRIESGVFAGNNPEDYIQERLAAVEEKVVSTKIQEMGNGRTIAISHQPMDDGGWVATHQDISDLRRVEAEMDHMAHHDVLTGLPNRSKLRSRIEEALLHTGQGEEVAVMSLDIDRFKSVNDSLGHPVGDQLLKMVAKRLNSCARECDTVARLGSDEFGIVQVGAYQPEDATALAQRIFKVIKRPFVFNGHEVIVGASVGISIAPNDGVDPDTLLRNASMALYEAKHDASGSFRFFEPGMDSDVKTRRKMDIDLRKALELGQFELHYQPLQNLETGGISGLEALLRWRHPERGLVSPVEFIPIAEEIGLIVPLGEWVIRQACADASLWPDDVKIAVNVSPVQFRKGNIVSTVMSALSASQIDPRRLELEITEWVLLNNSESTLSILHQLRGLGVRIAMDDFGTGYSSLSYLRSFPFDKIKIDGSFIHDLDNSEDALVIVRAVASLGKSLGMTTTAECVETVEQRDAVAAEGYTEIQGYFFSPPRPAEEIVERFFGENMQVPVTDQTEVSMPDLISRSG